MLRLKEGDPVRIVDRVITPSDLRAGLYYTHFRNLTGSVFKLYGKGDTQQAAIDIDLSSLSPEISLRHCQLADSMRRSLVGEARRNGDAGFRLRYIVLVSVSDLIRQPASRRAAP